MYCIALSVRTDVCTLVIHNLWACCRSHQQNSTFGIQQNKIILKLQIFPQQLLLIATSTGEGPAVWSDVAIRNILRIAIF
jgi:hypothetical protein